MPRTHTLATKTAIRPYIPNELHARMVAKMADRARPTTAGARYEEVSMSLSDAVTEALEAWVKKD